MIKINLFDGLWPQSPSSTAGKEASFVETVRGQMEWDGITVFTDTHVTTPIVEMVQSPVKVAWLREPYCLHPQTYHYVHKHADRFDIIQTYYEPLLQAVPHARFVPYGGVWIERKYWGLHTKYKLLSMLYGNKVSTEGHRLRQHIAEELDGMTALDFFGAKGTPTIYGEVTKRLVLTDYCYSIVVETCRDINLFTEILLDCLAVGTVPIFWGCPNIGDFFNTEGILSFENMAELHHILNDYVSYDDFQRRKKYLLENLRLVKNYEIAEDWMYHHYYGGSHDRVVSTPIGT